jgi:hypothetical protein
LSTGSKIALSPTGFRFRIRLLLQPVSRLRQTEGRKCPALLQSVAAAGRAPLSKAQGGPHEGGRRSRPDRTEEKMRVISQSELLGLTPAELPGQIACDLPRGGSVELRAVHANLL